MPIRVTVEDTETGDTETCEIGNGPAGYVVTCGPGCDVTHVQTYANGTAVVTIRPRLVPEASEPHDYRSSELGDGCAICREGVAHYLHHGDGPGDEHE